LVETLEVEDCLGMIGKGDSSDGQVTGLQASLKRHCPIRYISRMKAPPDAVDGDKAFVSGLACSARTERNICGEPTLFLDLGLLSANR
jgi:hypothetical protein